MKWLSLPLWISLAALLCVPLAVRSADDAPAKTFYLPKNPTAAAYILGRLSNQELAEAPRSEYVYVALLERKGMEKKYRVEALDGLAKLRQTDRLTELLRAFQELDAKGENALPVIEELSALPLQLKAADLKSHRAGLEKLATDAQQALTRQIGLAALVTADGSVEKAWQLAAQSDQATADFLNAIPLLRQPELRAALYPRIEPFLGKDDQPELQQAAIHAISAVPGKESGAFRALSKLIKAGTQQAAAVASLQSIPSKFWPADQVEPLTTALVSYLQSVPPGERTAEDYANAVQFTSDLASTLEPEKGRAIQKTLRGLGVRVIVLRTVREQMLYDKNLIVVEAGKPVELVLQNDDIMPHNVVVVVPGALEEIGLAAEKMAPEPDAEGRLYIPDNPKVLHATKLLDPGEREKLVFTAPDEPGDYQYVCTFPGHWRRMVGTMAVVQDIDAYLATHGTPAQPQMTEWQLSDLAPELTKIGYGRNLEKGHELFTKLACAQCHKMGQEGYAYGPELTDVFNRWKNDPAAVLDQILEPSKTIEDRYRVFEFELQNGDTVTGMIVKEDEAATTVQSGPADALIQAIPRKEIKSREPQSNSVMPLGLLSLLSKDEIFDLLAFLESGGKMPSHEHAHGAK